MILSDVREPTIEIVCEACGRRGLSLLPGSLHAHPEQPAAVDLVVDDAGRDGPAGGRRRRPAGSCLALIDGDDRRRLPVAMKTTLTLDLDC